MLNFKLLLLKHKDNVARSQTTPACIHSAGQKPVKTFSARSAVPVLGCDPEVRQWIMCVSFVEKKGRNQLIDVQFIP